MFRQQRDVVQPLPQRRNLNRKHVQPVKEVFAESACGGCFLQIPVGRGHDAHIGAARPVVTNSFVPLLLKDAQQLVLNIQRNFPHFIQEDGSALGGFKASGPVLHGSGERASARGQRTRFRIAPVEWRRN